ncbi:MAG: transcriptional repressor [Chloroflexi bacterium]|nr:transcriptional repressor [Chloroflexota bacterium]
MTEQRQTIIELLAASSERIDAESLHQRALKRDPHISLTTVYRTLDVLEASELIRAQFISPDHSRKYFSLTLEPYHFTCRRCHRVIAFAADELTALRQRLETDLHIQVFNACLCVEGLCPECAQATQKDDTMPQILAEQIR